MGIDEIDAVDRVRQPMIDNMSNSVTVARLMRNSDYCAVGSHHNGVKKVTPGTTFHSTSPSEPERANQSESTPGHGRREARSYLTDA